MAGDNQRGALFRPIVPNQHNRVTYAELFFDLVFVFAVTQISHTLLGRFTPLGALQMTLLFLGVWWVWVYTSWVTNWLDPERTPVRILLFGLMRARALNLNTKGIRIKRTMVRHRLRDDAGRPDRLSAGIDPAEPAFVAKECDPHAGLALRIGGVLDRGRHCGRAVQACSVGSGSRD
jgi:hypothetical protein